MKPHSKFYAALHRIHNRRSSSCLGFWLVVAALIILIGIAFDQQIHDAIFGRR